MEDSHYQLWLDETRETARDIAWDRWATNVERSLGHSLDGNGPTDGYSLDEAYDWFMAGLTASEAADRVRASKAALGGNNG